MPGRIDLAALELRVVLEGRVEPESTELAGHLEAVVGEAREVLGCFERKAQVVVEGEQAVVLAYFL